MTQLSSPTPGVQIYHEKVKITGGNTLHDDDQHITSISYLLQAFQSFFNKESRCRQVWWNLSRDKIQKLPSLSGRWTDKIILHWFLTRITHTMSRVWAFSNIRHMYLGKGFTDKHRKLYPKFVLIWNHCWRKTKG